MDSKIKDILNREAIRQENTIELIASENFASDAVMELSGSIFTNKYAEGYPGKRYYNGCDNMDEVEQLAIDTLCKLYGANFANVQPHCGANANTAVYQAFLKPGDKILGMDLASGGHLSHGAPVIISGKVYEAHHYGVDEAGWLDYDAIYKQAEEVQPNIIVAGASAYPRQIDWAKFRAIADSVGALLLVDMAHFSGLVAGGVYPNPLEYADVVTSTTHKVLRGPRGGIILTNNEELIKKFNSAIFPGLQGGPLMHVVAAKAVCFKEALDDSFKNYAKKVVANAKTLSETLIKNDFKIFSGGTDTHLMLLDLRDYKLTGKLAEKSLGNANITCNKNAIPFDTESPMITSGVRLGTPASTTRGFGEKEFILVGQLISKLLKGLAKNPENNSSVEAEVQKEVIDLCSSFPIYSS